jgi:hypothetical protein
MRICRAEYKSIRYRGLWSGSRFLDAVLADQFVILHPSSLISSFKRATNQTMSDSGDYSEMSVPVQYGQRRAIPRGQAGQAGLSGRKHKQLRPMVGGDVVGSMKRGIKDHAGDLRRRESRLLILCESCSFRDSENSELICQDSIAGALFCILTGIWVKKLYAHWSNWSEA